MHPTEPKNAFLLMRANGWSLRSISQQLGIPKSTLFDWESEPPTRRTINVLKSLQVERLQEQYIPSFEEELQKLSNLLSRIESALSRQDFDDMRPEFLLRTSLQVRSRLNKLRSDIQPTHTLNNGELPSVPLPGCISRSETIGDSGDSRCPLSPIGGEGQSEGTQHSGDDDSTLAPFSQEPTCSSPSPLNGERAGVRGEAVPDELRFDADVPQTTPANGTNPDKTEYSSEPDSSTSTTSNGQNRTPVRIPGGDTADEIALTASFAHREPSMAT